MKLLEKQLENLKTEDNSLEYALVVAFVYLEGFMAAEVSRLTHCGEGA